MDKNISELEKQKQELYIKLRYVEDLRLWLVEQLNYMAEAKDPYSCFKEIPIEKRVILSLAADLLFELKEMIEAQCNFLYFGKMD